MTSTVATTNWSQTFYGAILIPLLAAAAAAAVVVGGYLYDRRNKRRDELRELFSRALRAVAEYQELPYLVRRRSHNSPMTSAELAARASGVQVDLDYYVARLSLELPTLGEAYGGLVQTVRKESGQHITSAWESPRIAADDEMMLRVSHDRTQGEAAKSRCIEVMREYLSRRLPRTAAERST